jgi:hypothetical protein
MTIRRRAAACRSLATTAGRTEGKKEFSTQYQRVSGQAALTRRRT